MSFFSISQSTNSVFFLSFILQSVISFHTHTHTLTLSLSLSRTFHSVRSLTFCCLQCLHLLICLFLSVCLSPGYFAVSKYFLSLTFQIFHPSFPSFYLSFSNFLSCPLSVCLSICLSLFLSVSFSFHLLLSLVSFGLFV